MTRNVAAFRTNWDESCVAFDPAEVDAEEIAESGARPLILAVVALLLAVAVGIGLAVLH